MKYVEVNSPRSLDLTRLINKDNTKEINSIRQTIDIYDSITIWQEIKKTTGIVIDSKDFIYCNLKEQMIELINIYKNYMGINIRDLIIEIKKNSYPYFSENENILSGLLIALNCYYKSNLTYHELVYLSEKINSLTSYYIMGGYKKILSNNKIKIITDNPYHRYIVMDTNNYEKDDRLKLSQIINKYPFIDYVELNNDVSYIGIRDQNIVNIPLSIKREIPKTKMNTFNNSIGNKVLIKYIK